MAEPECHICGREAEGTGFVEGAKVLLCGECARYAKNFGFFRREAPPAPEPRAPPPKKPRGFEETELAEDFAKRIAQARERKGWTREQFGKRLAISHQEVTGFEENRIKPTNEQAKKIEYALGIKLFEEESTVPQPIDLSALAKENRTRKGGTSLADVVEIKKK